MTDERIKSVLVGLCLFIVVAIPIGAAWGATTAQAPAGISREIIANFVGTMSTTQTLPTHEPISREIIANFAGVMKEVTKTQINAPISREIVANFVGSMKTSPQAQTPVAVPQKIQSPLGLKTPEMLRKK
jgi:hypothetical protein